MGKSSDEEPEKAYITDCEGPISKNDNAFEIAEKFLPNGGELFTILSEYDDVKSEIVQDNEYVSGSTLKFILPFLKAYDVTDVELLNFSQENISLVPGAEKTLGCISSMMPVFVVSTSYGYYINALREKFDFLFDGAYSTEVSLDDFSFGEGEKSRLIKIKEKIESLDRIKFPRNAKNLDDIPVKSRKTVHELDEIFEEKIPSLEIGNILEEVEPVGGRQKAESIREISKDLEIGYDDMIYIGDSITDVEAFQTLKEKGGLTVSFNGNKYAVENAEIIVASENALILSLLSRVFKKYGKEGTLNLVKNWSRGKVDELCDDEELKDRINQTYSENLPLITAKNERVNIEKLVEDSSYFRKKVRGKQRGRLG